MLPSRIGWQACMNDGLTIRTHDSFLESRRITESALMLDRFSRLHGQAVRVEVKAHAKHVTDLTDLAHLALPHV